MMEAMVRAAEVIDAEAVPELDSETQQLARSLRDFADYVEKHPELRFASGGEQTFYLFPRVDELSKVARAFGNAAKDVLGDSFFVLKKQIGVFTLQASWGREDVCERVVVGREMVEEKVPSAYETRIVERDKVEWKCPKGILQGKGE
jgi:hypothetical protein